VEPVYEEVQLPTSITDDHEQNTFVVRNVAYGRRPLPASFSPSLETHTSIEKYQSRNYEEIPGELSDSGEVKMKDLTKYQDNIAYHVVQHV